MSSAQNEPRSQFCMSYIMITACPPLGMNLSAYWANGYVPECDYAHRDLCFLFIILFYLYFILDIRFHTGAFYSKFLLYSCIL